MSSVVRVRVRTKDDEVRRIVGHQIAFVGHAVIYALTCFLLFVVAGRHPAVIVAISWGIALATHGWFAVLAPMMRAGMERGTKQLLGATATERALPQPGREARSVEALAAAVAHEIRNPITAAKSLVQQIAEDPAAAENREYAAVAIGELDRVERSIVHLLRFAREEAVESTELRMIEVAESALETLRDRTKKLGVHVTTSLEDTGVMEGDEEKLRRVITNLVANALDAIEEAQPRSPTLELASGTNLAGDEIWVAVRDNGGGLGEEAIARIFEPFFTSKATGHGFGLALARKTIAAHGGTIEAKNRPSGGAEVSFSIPRVAPTAMVRDVT